MPPLIIAVAGTFLASEFPRRTLPETVWKIAKGLPDRSIGEHRKAKRASLGPFSWPRALRFRAFRNFQTVSPRTPLNKGLAMLPLGVPVTIAAEVAISG